MKIAMGSTSRGFSIGVFKDRYDKDCSIQKSSLAQEDCIWLGLDEGVHAEGACMARMHLNQEMAEELISVLQLFVDTGEL